MTTLQNFKANVKNIARANRFKVTFPSLPTDVALETNYAYFVRSVGTPTKTIGEITNLFWQGMNYKMGGDMTFEPLTLRFLNIENHALKAQFEQWLDLISNTIDNTRGEPESYKATLLIEQLDHTNAVTAKYYCYGVFPTTVSSIELSQESSDTLQEFDVTLSIDYFSNSATEGDGEGTADVTTATGSLAT